MVQVLYTRVPPVFKIRLQCWSISLCREISCSKSNSCHLISGFPPTTPNPEQGTSIKIRLKETAFFSHSFANAMTSAFTVLQFTIPHLFRLFSISAHLWLCSSQAVSSPSFFRQCIRFFRPARCRRPEWFHFPLGLTPALPFGRKHFE